MTRLDNEHLRAGETQPRVAAQCAHASPLLPKHQTRSLPGPTISITRAPTHLPFYQKTSDMVTARSNYYHDKDEAQTSSYGKGRTRPFSARIIICLEGVGPFTKVAWHIKDLASPTTTCTAHTQTRSYCICSTHVRVAHKEITLE
jgi:hypothetical protein